MMPRPAHRRKRNDGGVENAPQNPLSRRQLARDRTVAFDSPCPHIVE